MPAFNNRHAPATGRTSSNNGKEYKTVYAHKNVPFFSENSPTMLSLTMLRNVEIGSKYNNDLNSLVIRLSLKAEGSNALAKNKEGKTINKSFNVNNYDANLLTTLLSFMEGGGCNIIAIPHISKDTGDGSQLNIYSNGDGTYELTITTITNNVPEDDYFSFNFDRLVNTTVFNGDEEISLDVNIEWEKFLNILRYIGAAASGITEADYELYSGRTNSNSGTSAANSAGPVNVERRTKINSLSNRFGGAKTNNARPSMNDIDDGENEEEVITGDASDIDVDDDEDLEKEEEEVPVVNNRNKKKVVPAPAAPAKTTTEAPKKNIKKVSAKNYTDVNSILDDMDEDEEE